MNYFFHAKTTRTFPGNYFRKYSGNYAQKYPGPDSSGRKWSRPGKKIPHGNIDFRPEFADFYPNLLLSNIHYLKIIVPMYDSVISENASFQIYKVWPSSGTNKENRAVQ